MIEVGAKVTFRDHDEVKHDGVITKLCGNSAMIQEEHGSNWVVAVTRLKPVGVRTNVYALVPLDVLKRALEALELAGVFDIARDLRSAVKSTGGRDGSLS